MSEFKPIFTVLTEEETSGISIGDYLWYGLDAPFLVGRYEDKKKPGVACLNHDLDSCPDCKFKNVCPSPAHTSGTHTSIPLDSLPRTIRERMDKQD